MKIRYGFLSLIFLLYGILASAQNTVNDECAGAIIISDTENYCSPSGAFSNQQASASAQTRPSCFPASPNSQDVWFVFTAVHTRVSIRVIGQTRIFTGGTLMFPMVAIYSGTCDNLTEIACDFDNDATNVVTAGATLNIGESYFIRVDTRGGSLGTFQLCMDSFEPVPDPASDCVPGVLLCDKSPFIVPFLATSGANPDEVTGPPCTAGNGQNGCEYEELQSAWYKWICKDPGTLTFTLTPLNPVDDLDFWLYELPNGYDDCTDKIPMLCMASGEVAGTPINNWIRCHGPTGLRSGENDDHENCGCDPGDNNFIEPLQMEAGKAYALVVMNFSNSGDGFSINFGGTGTFVGPDINFEIDPELENQCDIDTINFINNSVAGIGSITSFEWDFGSGATPRRSSAEGPHEVVYESFGNKNIVLRIRTDAGCAKTEIRQLFIEPCCDPATALAIDVFNITDPLCPGLSTGAFTVGGTQGNPGYLYSIDGVNFYPITQFNGLNPGDYRAWVQDIKGCRDSTDVRIQEPPPFSVDAGPDQTVDLGYDTELNGRVIGTTVFDIIWSGDTTLTCLDCLDPGVFPVVTTTYEIVATNPVGCRATDSVTVFVLVSRPIYIPSAFSPNDDGVNDYFTVFSGRQVRQIRRLLIFDRWGDLIYEGKDILPNVETLGWNGRFRGKRMDPAVFAYYTEVEFIDGVVVPYAGDVTLVK